MEIDLNDRHRQQLLEDGFVVVPGVIPPADLQSLRTAFERLVDRQREIWRQERKAGDPPDGVWETSAQPRLGSYDGLVNDRETAATVELILGRPREVSHAIMGAEEVAPTQFMLMCNPRRDHGPAAWHRDIHPVDQAPVCGLQADLLANGPGYLQWNLPLYDDDVLWVVPGSHRRPNSDAENAHLTEDPRQALPGGMQVELKAGDGVVYTNLILHWGSDYSAKLRRTVHFGFRSFGGQQLPYVQGLHRRGDARPHLSADAQARWTRHRALYLADCDRMETAFRAAIDGDGVRFREQVAALHPGEEERLVCAILLSKLAHKLRFEQHPERRGYGGDFTQEVELKPRFTSRELQLLWRRFEPLDNGLKAEGGEAFVPGYQSGPMSYRFEEMPDQPESLEAFVAEWS